MESGTGTGTRTGTGTGTGAGKGNGTGTGGCGSKVSYPMDKHNTVIPAKTLTKLGHSILSPTQ